MTNIVYMGMGEPLDNLANVMDSLEILCADYGFGLSPTRITVSTVGLVPAMRTFLEGSRCHLAVSLHTPFEEERRRLMPVENVYPLKEVLAELRRSALHGQRRVSFEYILFDRLNDTPRHARELARILPGSAAGSTSSRSTHPRHAPGTEPAGGDGAVRGASPRARDHDHHPSFPGPGYLGSLRHALHP